MGGEEEKEEGMLAKIKKKGGKKYKGKGMKTKANEKNA